MIGQGLPELTPVEIVGCEVGEAGSPQALDYGQFTKVLNAKKKEKEVVLVDENYEEQMLLLPNVSIKDIKKWLERVGV